jgi:hypothetical protein
LDTSENRSAFLESFEVWYWRRMEKIRCTDQVINEEVLQRIKEERNILHEIRRKDTWVGHILRRNCLVIEGIIERTKVGGRRGTRRKQLFDDLKERRGCAYW